MISRAKRLSKFFRPALGVLLDSSSSGAPPCPVSQVANVDSTLERWTFGSLTNRILRYLSPLYLQSMQLAVTDN